MFTPIRVAVVALGILLPCQSFALKLDLEEEINDVEILRHKLFATKKDVNQCQVNGESIKECYCQYRTDFDRLGTLYKDFNRKYPNLTSVKMFKYKIKSKPRFLSKAQYLKAIKFPYQCSFNVY